MKSIGIAYDSFENGKIKHYYKIGLAWWGITHWTTGISRGAIDIGPFSIYWTFKDDL